MSRNTTDINEPGRSSDLASRVPIAFPADASGVLWDVSLTAARQFWIPTRFPFPVRAKDYTRPTTFALHLHDDLG